MPILRFIHAHARRLTCAAALAAAGLGAGASVANAADANGYGIFIHDVVALPGDSPAPDAVSAYLTGPFPSPFWSTVTPGVAVYRGGALLEGPATGIGALDLAEGDEIRVLNLKPGAPSTTLGTFTYLRRPHLDAPVCAGATAFAGSRGPSARSAYGGLAVLWKKLDGPVAGSPTPAPTPTLAPGVPAPPVAYPSGSGTAPGISSYYPGAKPYDNTYPGWKPGWTVEQSVAFTPAVASADRFALTASKPVVAGMHLYHWGGSQPAPDLEVEVLADQIVEECGGAQGLTLQSGVRNAPTPAPVPVPTPVLDQRAPKAQAAVPSTKALRKLGIKRLLRTGLPLTISIDEPAQLTGSISLLGGKRPVRGKVLLELAPGKAVVKVTVPNALRRAIKAVPAKKTPKLQLKLTLVDAAGNVARLTTITIKLPKN